MDLQKAYKILTENKRTYNEIAEKFEQTRRRYSPELEELKGYIKEGEKVLDLGCGSGRLYEVFKNKNIDYLGLDFSEKLIEIARKKYGNFFVLGEILDLPFFDESFDSVWAISSLHHIPSKELRKKAVNQIWRVLRKGGRIIVTCWKIGSIFKKDVYIPFDGKKRYYHAFSKRELKRLFKEAGFSVEKLTFLKRGNKKTNILIIAKKI